MPLERESVLAERYRVEKILGEGGMGAVYLTKDLKFEKKYWAIKELFNPFQEPKIRKRAIEQFEQEANLLASLSHPYLPVVSDHFEEKGNHYLVMEYIEGTCILDEVMDNNPPIKKILHWGLQLCDVFEYLHSRKPMPVIFRDLKPDNIMLTSGEDVKLIDFGISKIFEEGTRTATFIQGAGTSGYSPPEQYTDGTDFTSDIYSLGCTLYSLLTGEVPPDSMKRVMEDATLLPMRELNPGVTQKLEEVVLKSMALKKENRYKDIKEMREALLDCLEDYKDEIEVTGRLVSPSMDLASVMKRLSGGFPAVKSLLSKEDKKYDSRKIFILLLGITVIITLSLLLLYIIINMGGKKGALPEPPSDMVYIPEGEFMMGRDNRKVPLQAFYIDKFEVSNKEYKKFIDETGHPSPAITDEMAEKYKWSGEMLKEAKIRYNWVNGNFPSGRDNYPVVLVDWEDAKAYAEWCGKRLPAELEWEKACRGDEGRLFPWGNDWLIGKCNTLISNRQDTDDTMPVDIYPDGVSPYGLYNTIGNVWEWTEDFYKESGNVIIKGGGWSRLIDEQDKPIYGYDRKEVPPDLKTFHLGFRCCKDVEGKD